MCWTLDPNTLEYSSSNFYNSGDIIAENLSMDAIIEKLVFFIKGANETGSNSTLPDLIIWNDIQLELLKKEIDKIEKLVKNIVYLQDRCYDIFKYDLRLQTFSLYDIADVMGLGDKEDYVKMAKIALKTEQEIKKLTKNLRNDAKTTKTTQNTEEAQATSGNSKQEE